MPVPPFTMMVATFLLVTAALILALIFGGSSFTRWYATTEWPASLSMCMMRWPLVSVSAVRVSLQVITTHPMELGAWDLCSCWVDALTEVLLDAEEVTL